MAGSKKTRTIVWAVDPFEKATDAIRSAAWTLRALAKAGDKQVRPVYLWGSTMPEMIPEPRQWTRSGMRRFCQERLGGILTRIKIPGMRPVHVRSGPYLGMRDGIKDLVAYAKRLDAELIVASTHGKKGLKRWTLGSFTETLALYSPVPLLLVHPNWRRTPDFETILFPTDFSSKSRRAFDQVLEFAAAHGSQVFLYHKLVRPGAPWRGAYFEAWVRRGKTLKSDEDASKSEGRKWADRGRSKGIKIDLIIDSADSARAGKVADAVLKRSKKLDCMIALSAQSGPLAAAVLGSAAREIIRGSEQPVWVIRS